MSGRSTGWRCSIRTPEIIDRIFTEDAVIETPSFTLRGRAEIRAMPPMLKRESVDDSRRAQSDGHGYGR
jgi:hypothetical protein